MKKFICMLMSVLLALSLTACGGGNGGKEATEKSEVQKIIAEGMDVPMEEVYGVATFYAQFNLNPKGKYKIQTCLGTACYVKGSGDLHARLEKELGIKSGECTPDLKFSLDGCRCSGACGLAPVIMINSDVYGRLVPDDIPGILAKYED